MTKLNVDNLVKSSWKVDNVHLKIGFSARYTVIAKLEGQFKDFDIKVDSGEDFTDSNVEVTIRTSRVDTGNPYRDNHLKSPDFLMRKIIRK